MLPSILKTKNILLNLSLSSLSSCTPGLAFSRFGTFKSVLPLIHQSSNCFQFRSFKSGAEEKFDESNMISNDPETEWLYRRQAVVDGVYDYHECRYYLALKCSGPIGTMEEEKSTYRERWATFRLIHKMEDAARRLIDENVTEKCHMFFLLQRSEIWALYSYLNEWSDDQSWMSLIKSSKQPLADKLRDKLEESQISLETFALSMGKLYYELLAKNHLIEFWSAELVSYGPEDVAAVLNNLPISETDYECIKLLFNLEEPEKWQIKNNYKEFLSNKVGT